jgi:hypothetical protein
MVIYHEVDSLNTLRLVSSEIHFEWESLVGSLGRFIIESSLTIELQLEDV